MLQCNTQEVIFMPHVTMRVTEDEKKWMENYAQVLGVNLSDAIKNTFFEKLEDEYDLKIVREHEKRKAEGLVKYYSLTEAKKELGIS
jgi:hypothetical protein